LKDSTSDFNFENCGLDSLGLYIFLNDFFLFKCGQMLWTEEKKLLMTGQLVLPDGM